VCSPGISRLQSFGDHGTTCNTCIAALCVPVDRVQLMWLSCVSLACTVERDTDLSGLPGMKAVKPEMTPCVRPYASTHFHCPNIHVSPWLPRARRAPSQKPTPLDTPATSHLHSLSTYIRSANILQGLGGTISAALSANVFLTYAQIPFFDLLWMRVIV